MVKKITTFFLSQVYKTLRLRLVWMNMGIIKIFKFYISNTDSPNDSQKYTNNILYYIYLFNHIHSWKNYLRKE